MGRFFEVVRRVLQEQKFQTISAESEDVIRVSVTSDNGRYLLVVQESEEADLLIVRAIAPVLVPIPQRASVGELLLRANSRMFVGSFDMDLEDGEVLFRIGLELEGVTPSDAMVWNVMRGGISMMDDLLPAIGTICFGGKEPQEALLDMDARKAAERGKAGPPPARRPLPGQAAN